MTQLTHQALVGLSVQLPLLRHFCYLCLVQYNLDKGIAGPQVEEIVLSGVVLEAGIFS